ncbi:MAG TPA: NAD(P)-dependent oxidoreductase [Candidatus Sulfotelmatobacter sp.]|nr:NAD(P)-dependent oxidoreductase [Candidatus Sulfotelmatobacter sp.]
MTWRDKTIFVTGATGFIGGRVCERLIQAGCKNVCAFVHTPHRAARIGRLPIQMRFGSLLNRAAVREALGKANLVVHCGLGVGRGIVEGTENLLQAAAAAGVERFVHMSTAAVYGLTPKPGTETEDAPLPHTGEPYCDNKGRAERVVLRFGRRGLPVVILRPSIVYGPYSAWSTRLIPDLKARRVSLINGGNGACNTTYVDNLIDAVFLGFENDKALGEAFFITDGERVTWGDFIQAHVKILGEDVSLPNLTPEEIQDYYRRQPGMVMGSFRAAGQALRSRELRQLLLRIPATKRVLDGIWHWSASLDESSRERIRARVGIRPAGLAMVENHRPMPDSDTLMTQSTTVFFSIEKAKKLLGYRPRVDFTEGMARVEQWLRFANYL